MHRSSVSAFPLRKASQLLVVLLLLAACRVGCALPRHENKVLHHQIETLEQEWREAILTNNVSEMNHLLADDYIGITSNGTIENKAQAVAQRSAGTVRITKLNLSDIHIRIYGDTAVVTSVANITGINGDSDISGKYRYTRVYTRRHGSWKIVSFEASRIHDTDMRSKVKH